MQNNSYRQWRGWSFVVVLVLLVGGLAHGVATESEARTQADDLNLDFAKAAVSEGVWIGTVSGDVSGTLTTILIQADTSEAVWQVEFFWVITAENPEHSFVARLTGTLDTETGEVQMSGPVVDGYREGAHVEESAVLVDADASRFEGTIRVQGAD